MQKIRDFIRGAAFAFEGIKLFYQTPPLWKYALFPLLPIVLVYAGLVLGGYYLVGYLSNFFAEKCADLPGFLQWLAAAASGAAAIGVVLIFTLIAVVSLGSLYELFGGLFFDALIQKFARSQCPEKLGESDWAFNCKAIVESIIYSTNTLFMIIALLLLNIFLPVLGQIIGVIVVSYRFGTAYLGMCGFHYRKTMQQTRTLARLNFMPVLGYGLSIYIIFLFPLAVIFTLPGLILGGVRLYDDITNS